MKDHHLLITNILLFGLNQIILIDLFWVISNVNEKIEYRLK